MEDLPDYMKLFFEALIGFFDEIEQETAKEGRPYCVHYCREMVYTFLIHSMFRELAFVRISDKENQTNLLGI